MSATFVIGTIAGLVSCFVSYAPLRTLKNTLNAKVSESLPVALPGMPYLAMFANSLIWTSYGLMQHDTVIAAQNFFSLCVACYCAWLLWQDEQQDPATVTLHPPSLKQFYWKGLAVSVGAVAFLILLVLNGIISFKMIGYFGVVLALLQFGSPLVSLKQVFDQGFVGTLLDLNFSILLLLMGATWATYGLLIDDMNVYGPNLLGGVLACVQIFCFFIFPKTKDGWSGGV